MLYVFVQPYFALAITSQYRVTASVENISEAIFIPAQIRP
jgi:hypothetical protein